ncbi:hypothetical protein [Butyrivibrio sp. AE3004]|uniref:hypothetical protein n=1 Tax=Butyrivibrio sp. AE3004 TaxID=1506994 RepID=UPI000AB8B18E|nr:hypothetical protein [Butyrivibrio sp. AE3004]
MQSINRRLLLPRRSKRKVNIDSLEAIAFDPYTHGYYKVSGRVGEAFSDGKKLF